MCRAFRPGPPPPLPREYASSFASTIHVFPVSQQIPGRDTNSPRYANPYAQSYFEEAAAGIDTTVNGSDHLKITSGRHMTDTASWKSLAFVTE